MQIKEFGSGEAPQVVVLKEGDILLGVAPHKVDEDVIIEAEGDITFTITFNTGTTSGEFALTDGRAKGFKNVKTVNIVSGVANLMR